MGFWKRLFSGSNQPDKDSTVGVDPTRDEKMKAEEKKSTASEGAKFSGRTEETKAQKQADPETREIVQEAEEYPKESQPRGDVDAAKAGGAVKPKKSKEEQRKTQPKPAAEQKTTPHEAEPGTGKPHAGDHKKK